MPTGQANSSSSVSSNTLRASRMKPSWEGQPKPARSASNGRAMSSKHQQASNSSNKQTFKRLPVCVLLMIKVEWNAIEKQPSIRRRRRRQTGYRLKATKSLPLSFSSVSLRRPLVESSFLLATVNRSIVFYNRTHPPLKSTSSFKYNQNVNRLKLALESGLHR